MAKVARDVLSPGRGSLDFVQFGERLGGKIRNQSPLEHHAARDLSQKGAVLSVVGVRHKGIRERYFSGQRARLRQGGNHSFMRRFRTYGADQQLVEV